MIRFNYSVYGAEVCGILARFWCHRAQCDYNLEVVADVGEGLVFTEEHHAGYQEPSELVRLPEGGGGRAQVVNRARQIRGLLR